MRILVIGDTHFESKYDGQLRSQFDTLENIIKDTKPNKLVFLGDIFHHRNPDVKTLVMVNEFFANLNYIPGLSNIYIIMGNHDSANKSDDGLTALSVLEYPGSKVFLTKTHDCYPDLGIELIAHSENEKHSIFSLNNCAKDYIIFGHFGYDGCINLGEYQEFNIKREHFKNNRAILGHIHSFKEDGNLTILGTPWPTNYGESDYPHYVGILDRNEDGSWKPLEKYEVKSGPRYYTCPLESLEVMKDEISDPNYFTILRVIVNRVSDETSNDIRDKILRDYNIAYVEVKFQPLLNPKLDNRISDYVPSTKIEALSETVIDKYLEEQSSSIPKEELKAGLEEIRLHENQEDQG